jgi:hypothetical protein
LDPNEAVVAGSTEFVDALLPLLSQRLGGAPRVADSPHLASALCQGGARLLVYEHGGAEWLALSTRLRELVGPDLVVVAALPPEHAGDVARISASASAVVAWRGEAGPVLDATSRVLAAREAPPVAAAPRPSPVLTPRPTPSTLRPAPTPGRPAAPAVTPSPFPVRPANTPVAPRPATTPVMPRVPAATPPRPSAPVATPPGPAESFDGLFDESVAPDLTPVPLPTADAAPPTAPAPAATWPASVLSAADGLSVVRAALSGLWPEARLRPVTEAVVGSLSTAEKAAALGQKLPFDAAPVRRAVGLRWQVAAALDSLPPTGSPVDQQAVQGILLGIDEVLGALKEQGDDAGPESLRAVEAVRHALVKEAIDLTEALQKVAPAEVVEEITTSRRTRRPAAAPVTRMVVPPRALEAEPGSTPWGLVVLLVVVVLAGAAYHGYRYVHRPKPAPPPVAGAPAGTVGTLTPQGKVLVVPAGTKVDPKELEAFRNLERAKGNEVHEVAPGTFVVRPAGNSAGAPAKPDGVVHQGGNP